MPTTQDEPERASEDDHEAAHLFGRPLTRCPECGSDDLVPVVENQSQDVHFFCRACGRCWHVELGFVHRVVPPACLGCPEQERCEAVYAADQSRATP
jgi:transposase-like protein